MYNVVPTDFANDKNTMRRVIWGYIYTLKIKVTSKTAIETLSSLPYKKILRNMVVRGLHLLGKECKWWKLLGHAVQTEHYRISNPNNF